MCQLEEVTPIKHVVQLNQDLVQLSVSIQLRHLRLKQSAIQFGLSSLQLSRFLYFSNLAHA